MRTSIVLLLLTVGLLGQKAPSDREMKRLVRSYLDAKEEELPALEKTAALVPPLDAAKAKRWVKEVTKALAKGGPKLSRKGTSYFYDEKAKRGKYIVSGGNNRKGLVFGLHGGGVGSADCRGAASSFRGAVQSCGMIGIYPEAIEATEAAWGDDVTVTFILDLLAAARRTFKFDPERVYVVGHSMGGYGAWTWGGRFADRLAGTASFAGGPTPLWSQKKEVIGIQPGVLPSYFNVPLWVYHSADDPRVPIDVTRFAVKGLRALRKEHPAGFDFRYEEVDGRGHGFPKKGPLPALRWLTSKKRNARPKKILWEAFYEKVDQRYWLEWTQPLRTGQIVATWDGKQSFEVEGDAELADLALLLDDAMCDLDQPVTLRAFGKTLGKVTPERRFLTLLRSARRRRDPGLLFTARVPFKAR